MTLVVNRKQDVLMEYLSNFYNVNDYYIIDYLKVIAPESKTSLRVIDWFVTNFAKKNNTMFEVSNEEGRNHIVDSKYTGSKRQVIVYLNYKSQLKSYSKKQFDPFCRRERITYEYAPGKEITTTVGQLNFFKWALENCILDYINEHFTEIERDMIYTMRKNSPKGKKLNTRKKRQELSQAATKRINTHACAVTLNFV
jgi:hypothetical protein